MLKTWSSNEQKKWDELVATAPDGGFLQSWAWGDFQEALFNAVYRLSDEKEQWLAQAVQLKAGNHWILYLPRGPVAVGKSVSGSEAAGGHAVDGEPSQESLQAFLNDLKTFAKEKKCFLLRFDPAWSAKDVQLLKIAGATKAKRERQPIHTLIIDTTATEEELLADMKSKWRYNINLAQKKGVTFRWSDNPEDANHFYNLVKKTTQRQVFGSYDEDYYATLVEKLASNNQARFLFAEYEGKVIAALLVGFFGNYAYYLHGASDYEQRAPMAPHLLQWEAIKEAKKRNMSYDFWGVANDPPDNKQERGWAGITRFKRGFAPNKELTEYVGAYEVGIQKFWYAVYKLRNLWR